MAEGTDRYTATRLSAELGLDSLARAWRPPPILTVSQWADQTRRLSPEASAEPGRWYTARAEYMRGVMDAVSDPTVRQVVVMSAAQVGKTEVLLNMMGFHVDQDPALSWSYSQPCRWHRRSRRTGWHRCCGIPQA